MRKPPSPATMKDWLQLLLTSPLAAALTTALIGALLTNYVVDVFKTKSATAERKLQRQTDLATRQFETIQKLIDFESEYYVAVEFSFFNLIERRQNVDPTIFKGISADYDSAAKSFISNGYKAAFSAQVYLNGASTASDAHTPRPASSPQDVISIQRIFESIVTTEGKVAQFICKHDKSAAVFPNEALTEGKQLRDNLRKHHNEFVAHLSKAGAVVYHPSTH
jgi:hypothetical protein